MTGLSSSVAPYAVIDIAHRFVNVGGIYNFKVDVSSAMPIVIAQKITLYLGNMYWTWQLQNWPIPFVLNNPVQLPNGVWGGWRPWVVIEGYDNMRHMNSVEFQFGPPVIATNLQPVFDSRLACSIQPMDQWKIDPIRNHLNAWGFDCSTLGVEFEAKALSGNALLESEKEWAKGGDCFIAVLTQRDVSAGSGLGLPTAWTHAESGLSYDRSKPMLAFVESGVRADAIFKQLDADHEIEFDPYNTNASLIAAEQQLHNFRTQCSEYRSQKSKENLKNVAVGVLAAVGAVAVLAKIIK